MIMNTNDNLSKLFGDIDLDSPSADFSKSVMNRIYASAEKDTTKISFANFMVLITGVSLAIAMTAVTIFREDIFFFFRYHIAPFLAKMIQAVFKYMPSEAVSFYFTTYAPMIVSITLFLLVFILYYNKRDKSSSQKIEN